MNKLRRKDLREITDQLETLQELLQELQEQEKEYPPLRLKSYRRCNLSVLLKAGSRRLPLWHFLQSRPYKAG